MIIYILHMMNNYVSMYLDDHELMISPERDHPCLFEDIILCFGSSLVCNNVCFGRIWSDPFLLHILVGISCLLVCKTYFEVVLVNVIWFNPFQWHNFCDIMNQEIK